MATTPLVIDRAWIAARLSGRRGERAALAAAMGVRPDVVAKIMAGTREVHPREFEAIARFFNVTHGALAEPEAEPWEPPAESRAGAAVAAARARRNGLQSYRVKTPAPWLGCLAGDILLVEPYAEPAPGDIVLALSPGERGPETAIRLYQPPWLSSGAPGEPPEKIDPTRPDQGVQAVVRGLLRGPVWGEAA